MQFILDPYFMEDRREMDIQNETSFNVLDNAFDDFENKISKLMESNAYLQESIKEDPEFIDYIKENRLLIDKYLDKMSQIVERLFMIIPGVEMAEYEVRLEKVKDKLRA